MTSDDNYGNSESANLTNANIFSIRVGRSIQGFGLSPGITKEQRVGVENLFKGACQKFSGELN